MEIPEHCLERLQAAGLVVARPFSPTHNFANGRWVGKPKDVPGNCIPDYEQDGGDCVFDAPAVLLFGRENDKWYVSSEDFGLTEGSGDFLNEWTSASEAVSDILDFYFGDPARMAKKAIPHMRYREAHKESFASESKIAKHE